MPKSKRRKGVMKGQTIRELNVARQKSQRRKATRARRYYDPGKNPKPPSHKEAT